MSLNKSKGNMYSWVTHTHAHLGGECPHKCTYCYVDSFRQRVLIEKELEVNYGEGKTIFIENCNDLFAEDVPKSWILKILAHCREWPKNTYVFQTKNPERYLMIDSLLYHVDLFWPEHIILGTTVETNRDIPEIGNAPQPRRRMAAMIGLLGRTFITIEPILDFDIGVFSNCIRTSSPDFVNIGADSKGHGLKEPTMEKVQALIDKLTEYGIEIREKSNLDRLR